MALAKAEGDVRAALKDSLNEANKYDLGTCMVEFKKCMMTEDACGKDWSNCVSTIADVSMQGEKENKVFKSDNMKKSAQKAYDGSTYGIAASTMESLDSKRIICEREHYLLCHVKVFFFTKKKTNRGKILGLLIVFYYAT